MIPLWEGLDPPTVWISFRIYIWYFHIWLVAAEVTGSVDPSHVVGSRMHMHIALSLSFARHEAERLSRVKPNLTYLASATTQPVSWRPYYPVLHSELRARTRRNLERITH